MRVVSSLLRSTPRFRSVSTVARPAVSQLRLPEASNNVRCMSSAASQSASIGNALKGMAEAMPEMDVVRYEHKNVKWSFKHVEYFADSLATGFLDLGLAPGDVVLSWLPEHFAEQHILQFACSKAGFVLYSLDPKQAIDDPEGAKAALAKALEVTEANVLVSQEAGDDVNYARLVKEVIPELRIYTVSGTMPFIAPRFPHLRAPVQTGYDIGENYGFHMFQHLFVPTGELQQLIGDAKITADTPVCGELTMGSDGLPAKGKVLTNKEVIAKGTWPTVTSILKKEYSEIEGVGVVF